MSATEEIQIMFSHASTLKQYEQLGIFSILGEKANNEVIVRILVATDHPIKRRDIEWLTEYFQIELWYLLKSIKTRLTTIVTDRELSLVIEEKSEDEGNLGLATYSNSESTVVSYASILENLWAQSTSQIPQTN